MALIKNRATGVTRDDSGAFTGSQTQVSTMMRVVSEQEFDRIETQINAANALIDSLRAAINNQSLVMKTTLVEKIELILDKYQRATAPKLTSAQVLAAFEQTRKLYDAWVSSLVYESRYPQAAHDSGVVQIWEQTTRICDRCVSWTPEK